MEEIRLLIALALFIIHFHETDSFPILSRNSLTNGFDTKSSSTCATEDIFLASHVKRHNLNSHWKRAHLFAIENESNTVMSVEEQADAAILKANKALEFSKGNEVFQYDNELETRTNAASVTTSSIIDYSSDLPYAAATGALIGFTLGAVIDITMMEYDPSLYPLPPLALGVALGVSAYITSSQVGESGPSIRSALSKPTKYLYNIITETIKGLSVSLVSLAESRVQETIEGVKKEVEATKTEVYEIPAQVQKAATDTTLEVVENIKATPGRINKSAKAVINDASARTMDAVNDASERTMKGVDAAVDEIKSTPEKIVSSSKGAIKKAVLETKEYVKEIPGKAIKFGKTAPKKIFDTSKKALVRRLSRML